MSRQSVGVTSNINTAGIQHGHKKLNIAVVGDRDAGKSTLCAKLLIQFGVFTHNDIQQAAKDAKMNGRNSYQYAFLLDRGYNERHYVHSIDCHIHQFRVARRRPNIDFTLIDTPGSGYVLYAS